MWSTNEALIGAMCEYANPPVNSITDPVLASYLRSGFHCAIGNGNPDFGIGEQCGKCYRLTSLNDNGQFGTAGSAGSAVVMISNKIGEGGTSHFDCILPGFKAITGAESGVFDMDFEETACDGITGTPTIINWADQNEGYCKMMFENIGGWGSLSSIKACLEKSDGSEACNDMQLFQGQTWIDCPLGSGPVMRFVLTQLSATGEAATIECSCSGAWPWPTGQKCSCPSNFIVPTEMPTTEAPTTTEAPFVTGFTPQAGPCDGGFLEALTGRLDTCAAKCKSPECDAFSMIGDAYCQTFSSDSDLPSLRSDEVTCYVRHGEEEKAPLGSIEKDLQKATSVGDTQMEVAGQAEFKVGDEIVIDPGFENQEFNHVKQFGSIICEHPLRKPHSAGAVVRVVAPPLPAPAETTTKFLAPKTTLTSTTSAVSSACSYTAQADTSVWQCGTGGEKLKRASYSSDAAYLYACKAGCNADPKCNGFVDDSSRRRKRNCKPKKAITGYHRLNKAFHVKGYGC